MHELSMALAIFETVQKILRENECKKVAEIELDLGETTLINDTQFKLALETIFEDELPFKNCKIKINTIEAIFGCKKCGNIWKPNLSYRSPMISHLENLSCVHCMDTHFTFMICPSCNSNEIDIKSGDECILKMIKIMG
ncbi:MAG: hydrogenase maturation nickel metallochaperone HypA [Candidatus Methylarchaceae archaeon HK01M]|nr:hydrogenase maturation nickel metallochaperone HypA [Candidatus Methylarchaceae archaeon HK01M]